MPVKATSVACRLLRRNSTHASNAPAGIIELRDYVLHASEYKRFLALSTEYAAARTQVYKGFLGMFTADTGGNVSRVVHMYHFENYSARDATRRAAAAHADWQRYTDAARSCILTKLAADGVGQLALLAHSDVGQLNQVYEVYRYPSAQRLIEACERSRGAAEWQDAKSKAYELCDQFHISFLHPTRFSRWQRVSVTIMVLKLQQLAPTRPQARSARVAVRMHANARNNLAIGSLIIAGEAAAAAAADMAGAADILALASENPVLAMGAGVAAIGTAVAATFAMANKATTQPTTALQAYEAATTDERAMLVDIRPRSMQREEGVIDTRDTGAKSPISVPYVREEADGVLTIDADFAANLLEAQGVYDDSILILVDSDGSLAPRAAADVAKLGLLKEKVFFMRGGMEGPKGWKASGLPTKPYRAFELPGLPELPALMPQVELPALPELPRAMELKALPNALADKVQEVQSQVQVPDVDTRLIYNAVEKASEAFHALNDKYKENPTLANGVLVGAGVTALGVFASTELEALVEVVGALGLARFLVGNLLFARDREATLAAAKKLLEDRDAGAAVLAMAKGATAELEKLAAIVREAKDPDTAAKTIQEQLLPDVQGANPEALAYALAASGLEIPRPVVEDKAEAETKSKADALAKAQQEAEEAARIKAAAAAKAKAEAAAKAQAAEEARLAAEAAAQAEAEAVAVAKAKAEAAKQAKADEEARAAAKAYAQAEEQARVAAEAAARAQAEEQARVAAEAAARAQAEEQARVAAEAAARAQAEEQARVAAEAAARAQAEEQARVAAEAAAKAQAEEQARVVAEAAARAQAEEQARALLAAEAAARAQAEEQARVAAEAAARAQAEEQARVAAEAAARAQAEEQARVAAEAAAKAQAEEQARARAEEELRVAVLAAQAAAEAKARAVEGARAALEAKARAEGSIASAISEEGSVAPAKRMGKKERAAMKAKAKAERDAQARVDEAARVLAEAETRAEVAAAAESKALAALASVQARRAESQAEAISASA
eukprot:XP_001703233.1 predicted protein [Chlamydomonas reinhardtii]